MKPAQVSALIFGDANLAKLSRATKIPASTLRSYKDKPGSIPLARLRVILKARRVSTDDKMKLIEG